MPSEMQEIELVIPAGSVSLEGTLSLPAQSCGVVAFAHGSGSSRHSPRNRYVAEVLQKQGIATLLFDLLTPREDQTYETRFDIDLLTERLLAATDWLQGNRHGGHEDRLFRRQHRRRGGPAGRGEARASELPRWSRAAAGPTSPAARSPGRASVPRPCSSSAAGTTA